MDTTPLPPASPSPDEPTPGSGPGASPQAASHVPPLPPVSGWSQGPHAGWGAPGWAQYQQGGPAGPGDGSGPGRPGPATSFFSSLRGTGLYRGSNRWVGGVCQGLADRFALDPVLVRVLVVALTMFAGVGLLLYSLAWMLLPEEADGRIHLESALQGEVSAGFAGACTGTLIGMLSYDDGFLPRWYIGTAIGGALSVLIPLALLAAGLWILFSWIKRPRPPQGPQVLRDRQVPHPAHPGSQPAAPGPGAAFSPSASLGPTSGPATGWPAAGWPRPVPPAYTRPPRPRVLGPGWTVSLLTLGLGLLTVAACGWALYLGSTGTAVPLVCMGALAVILGLAIVVSGLRGRSGGWLSAVGVLSLFALLPTMVLCGVMPSRTLRTLNNAGLSGTQTITWSEIRSGASLSRETGVGRVVVDLSDMPADAEPHSLDLEVGVGRVEVRVPKDRSVQVTSTIGLGNLAVSTSTPWRAGGTPIQRVDSDSPALGGLRHNLDGEPLRLYAYQASGVIDRQLTSPRQDARLEVKAEIGVGSLSITETPEETSTTWTGQVLEDGTWVVQSWSDDRTGRAGTGVPVPGTDHPAITDAQSQRCIDRALQVSSDRRGSSVRVLGEDDDMTLLGPSQHEEYKKCVAQALQAGPRPSPAATPSTAPTPEPSLTPEPSPAQG